MKGMISLCLVAIVSAVALARPDGQYTNKYDNLDLHEILHNDRLFDGQFNCLMSLGNCTPEGKELKEHLSEALEEDCAKCSEKHKEGIRTVIEFLIRYKPEEWRQLCAKYDPKNIYTKKYEEEIKKLQKS